MFINVTDGRLELLDPDNFRELKLVCASRSMLSDAAVDQLGRLDGDHVWVREAWFRAQAAAADGDWIKSFDAMRDYARSKGWIDGTGAIRVHIEVVDGG